MSHPQSSLAHSHVSRRTALQVGSIGLLGLGLNHVAGLRSLAAENGAKAPTARAKSVIYIFLSGGLAQHESFDPKPAAPDNVRGEFSPIATRTPGLIVCEHLPLLAARSDKWALVRSLTHPYNDHSTAHHVMLTGQTPTPQGFDGNRPKPTDFPAIASVVSGVASPRNNLPPAAVLPEKLVHVTGRTIPGQFAGEMGSKFDPWVIEASQYRDTKYIHAHFPSTAFNDRQDAPRFPIIALRLRGWSSLTAWCGTSFSRDYGCWNPSRTNGSSWTRGPACESLTGIANRRFPCCWRGASTRPSMSMLPILACKIVTAATPLAGRC